MDILGLLSQSSSSVPITLIQLTAKMRNLPCYQSYNDVNLDSRDSLNPMNKQEAADYLGVSTRAIERYTQKGKRARLD